MYNGKGNLMRSDMFLTMVDSSEDQINMTNSAVNMLTENLQEIVIEKLKWP